jgi:hypothetical protein
LGRLTVAGIVLALVLGFAQGPVAALFSAWPTHGDEATLAVLAAVGALVYGGMVLALFGPQWLAAWRRRPRLAAEVPLPPPT